MLKYWLPNIPGLVFAFFVNHFTVFKYRSFCPNDDYTKGILKRCFYKLFKFKFHSISVSGSFPGRNSSASRCRAWPSVSSRGHRRVVQSASDLGSDQRSFCAPVQPARRRRLRACREHRQNRQGLLLLLARHQAPLGTEISGPGSEAARHRRLWNELWLKLSQLVTTSVN
jgi:hypothetical protein